GFQFNFLFAPGQNRAGDSSNLPSAEADCAQGNDPTSGANVLISCSDGAFSNLLSTNLSYTNGPLYMTAAYDWHQKVNRQSDLAGAYGVPFSNLFVPGAVIPATPFLGFTTPATQLALPNRTASDA